MIRADLAEARMVWLESFKDARQRAEAEESDFLTYCDAEGRYADLHSLRHTYISRVVRCGTSAKAAQTLARHSTVQLTVGRYAHANVYDLTAAVDALPSLCSSPIESLAATGTDGRPISLGPFLGLQTDCLGHSERQTETEEATGSQTIKPGKSGKNCESPGWESNPQVTRTGDFKSPAFAISPPGEASGPNTVPAAGRGDKCVRQDDESSFSHQSGTGARPGARPRRAAIRKNHSLLSEQQIDYPAAADSVASPKLFLPQADLMFWLEESTVKLGRVAVADCLLRFLPGGPRQDLHPCTSPI